MEESRLEPAGRSHVVVTVLTMRVFVRDGPSMESIMRHSSPLFFPPPVRDMRQQLEIELYERERQSSWERAHFARMRAMSYWDYPHPQRRRSN